MKRIFSCVVDNKEKFEIQAFYWWISLKQTNKIAPEDVLIHAVEPINPKLLSFFEKEEIRVIPISPFGAGPAAYCNKLMQLQTKELLDADQVLLCDTDLLFVGDILEELDFEEEVAAKLVDRSNPNLGSLEKLFKKSRIKATPQLLATEFAPNAKTFYSNCNGGLYFFNKGAISSIRESWLKWAKWCLKQEKILGAQVKHADQLGFCFAIMEEGISLYHLPSSLNFPTHFKPEVYDHWKELKEPVVLHYHFSISEFEGYQFIGPELAKKAFDSGKEIISRNKENLSLY